MREQTILEILKRRLKNESKRIALFLTIDISMIVYYYDDIRYAVRIDRDKLFSKY